MHRFCGRPLLRLKAFADNTGMHIKMQRHGETAGVPLERRTQPRFDLLSAVDGETGAGDPVALLNVSEGGAMVVTSAPMQVGDTHEFSFEESPGVRCVVPATVIHVMRGTRRGAVQFFVGLKFFPARTESQRTAIQRLIALASDE